jgi:hypothetical protein
VGTIDVFMRQILDYAGMFPPAKLPPDEAVRNFQDYQHHEHADFLGRFVAPLAQLPSPRPAPLSLIVKPAEIDASLRQIEADSIEVAWSNGHTFGDFLTLLDNSFPGKIFIELDWRKPYVPLMAALSERAPRFGVKLRTGGVTPESIPPSKAIADFLLAAADHKLPLKATAGLHVPVPNDDPAVGARMHGFLNFFCAGFLAFSQRGDRTSLTDVLENFGYEDFSFGGQSMRCGTFEFSKGEIEQLRSRWLLSFGSCSFLEPIEHLKAHSLISK